MELEEVESSEDNITLPFNAACNDRIRPNQRSVFPGFNRYNFMKKRRLRVNDEEFVASSEYENQDHTLGKLNRWLRKSKKVPDLQHITQRDCQLDSIELEDELDDFHEIPDCKAEQQDVEGDSLKPSGGSLNLALNTFDKSIEKVEIRCHKRCRPRSPRGTSSESEFPKENKEVPDELESGPLDNRIEPDSRRMRGDTRHGEDEESPAAERPSRGKKWAKYVLQLPRYLLYDPGRMERVFTQPNILPTNTRDFSKPSHPQTNSFALAQALLEYVMVDPDPESEVLTAELQRVESACVLETHPCAVVLENKPSPYPEVHYFQVGNDHKWVEDELEAISPNGIVGLANRLLGKQSPKHEQFPRHEYEENEVRPFTTRATRRILATNDHLDLTDV